MRQLPKHQGTAYPVSVKQNTTLGEFFELIVKTKLHRVYVVDDNDVPLGVASLTDVLAHFASE